MRWLRFLVWIIGAIIALSVISMLVYFFVLPQKFSIPQQSISKYTSAIFPTTAQPRPGQSQGMARNFFYQSHPVKLIQGDYQKVLAGRLMTIKISGKDEVFSLAGDTKTVCQPSGFLNVDVSSGGGIPANDVYIEDKREGNLGVPWGLEFPNGNVMTRVKQGSPAQLFIDDSLEKTTLTAKLHYVWFSDCNQF